MCTNVFMNKNHCSPHWNFQCLQLDHGPKEDALIKLVGCWSLSWTGKGSWTLCLGISPEIWIQQLVSRPRNLHFEQQFWWWWLEDPRKNLALLDFLDIEGASAEHSKEQNGGPLVATCSSRYVRPKNGCAGEAAWNSWAHLGATSGCCRVQLWSALACASPAVTDWPGRQSPFRPTWFWPSP